MSLQRLYSLRRHILVSQLHNSKISESDLLQQLRNDRSHRWIGIPESVGDHEIKLELLLYSALTGQFTNADTAKPLLRLPRKQCPRLVSFIGDTGVGKSTIVKNLIRLVPISPDSGALETSPVPLLAPLLDQSTRRAKASIYILIRLLS